MPGRKYAFGTAGDAAVRALHPEQAGVAGRDADRAAAVAAGRERDEAARDRGRAPRRRSADGASVAPRVVGDAVELRDADVEAAELARGREPDGDRAAGSEQALDHRAGARGDAVAIHERGFGRGPSGDAIELLHADGHAAERLRDVGVFGGAQRCRVGVDERERVEIALVDRGERRLELFARGALAASERVDERAGVIGPRAVGHAPMISYCWPTSCSPARRCRSSQPNSATVCGPIVRWISDGLAVASVAV